jgi:hypothetical protein
MIDPQCAPLPRCNLTPRRTHEQFRHVPQISPTNDKILKTGRIRLKRRALFEDCGVISQFAADLSKITRSISQ